MTFSKPSAQLLLLLLCATGAVAQQTPSLNTTSVDSRTGYVARLPENAMLDARLSGWSVKGQFERRVYRIEDAGEIRITSTVRTAAVPKNATVSDSYTWLDADSATAAGTAYSRTYYLPTRSVRIELIPYGVAMAPVIATRQSIYDSFRWKPGAESDRVDVP